MELTKTQRTKAIIAVCLVAIVGMSANTVATTFALMASEFGSVSDTQIQMIAGLPNLMSVPVGLLAMRINNKISMKNLLIIGALFMLAGGLGIFAFTSFSGILVCRAVFGLGNGLLHPLTIANVAMLFDGQMRNKALGLKQAFTLGGGLMFTLLGGWLGTFGWRYTYLCYLVLIPAVLALIFWMPDAGKTYRDENAPREKMVISKSAIRIFISIFFIQMICQTNCVNLAFLVDDIGLGSSGTVGIFMAATMIAGFVFGFLFKPMYSKLGRYMITFGMLCEALCQLLCAYHPTYVSLLIGNAFIGIALASYEPTFHALLSRCVPKTSVTAVMGIWSAILAFSNFMTSYIITPLGDVHVRFYVTAGIAVVYLIVDLCLPPIKYYGSSYRADRPLPSGVALDGVESCD